MMKKTTIVLGALALAGLSCLGEGKAPWIRPPSVAGGLRGYSLDISRCKVPKMETLFRIVDILAKLKYNHFAFYIEHTFAYSQHRVVWEEASPMTAEEIRALDDYCYARGIEFGPDQQVFGHMERWLRHPEYNGLAELPQAGDEHKVSWLPGGKRVGGAPLCLCPTDPRTFAFVAGLLDEMLPCYRSKLVNVHCDETAELYDNRRPYPGRSAAALAAKGPTGVYLDYLNRIHDLCAARGCTMLFDGDIVLGHPECVSSLPKDAVCNIWRFEGGYPFAQKADIFEKAGRRYILLCSTSDWCSLFGRTRNVMRNIDDVCAAQGRPHCLGCQIDSYGDGGNPQPWIVNVPPLVYFSHRVRGETMTRAQLAAAVDALLGCKCGEALLAYGDLYEKIRGRTNGGSELFWLLEQGKGWVPNVGASESEYVSEASKVAMLEYGHSARKLADLTDAPEWVKDDFALIDLLFRAVETRIREPGKKNFKACFEPEYRRLWRKSNRVGGLTESVNRVFGQP